MGNITWTAKQVEIYKAITAGIPPKQIAKDHHCSHATVTAISNAIKKGQLPPHVMSQNAKKLEKAGDAATGTATKTKKPVKKTAPPVETTDDEEEEVEEEVESNIGQSSAGNAGTDDATMGKLIPVPVYIPITPVMLVAKAYVIQRLGWNPDVKWQDLIDTVFYNYFKSLDPPVILHGWVEGDPVGTSPKPASVKAQGNGNGHFTIDPNDPQTKKIIVDVANQLVQTMMSMGQVGV
jgi:hypothetical protein